MVPQVATHQVCPYCRWLWHWVLWLLTCQAPFICPWQNLQSYHCLDRIKICRHRHQLGLHQANLLNHNGWLHCSHCTQVWAQSPIQTAVLTAQTLQNNLWPQQLSLDADNSLLLDAAGIKQVQWVVSLLLYYAPAVDNKLLVVLSAISMQQAKATTNTMVAVSQLLTLPHTQPMALHTTPAIWSWQHTLMPVSSARSTHAARLELAYSSPKMTP